jgi:hypothetical protein
MAKGWWHTLPFEKKKNMISVTGVTNNYSVQPALLEKHSKTLSWLSVTMHWKSELAFYEKLLNEMKPLVNSHEVLAEVENLENRTLYFTMEGIEELRRKLRNHESRLAKMLEAKAEWDTQYYNEHDALMESAKSLSEKIDILVNDLRTWKIIREHAHHLTA